MDIVVAAPGTVVIGYGPEASDELLAEAREFGIEDILPAPYLDRDVFVAIQKAIKSPGTQRRPVVAFQPASGGCGSSTIALNVASALANQFNRKVLLSTRICGPVRCRSGLTTMRSRRSCKPWRLATI